MCCQMPTRASHNQKRQIRSWQYGSIVDFFSNIYNLQVKCEIRKNMYDDGTSFELKDVPHTHLEAIYLVGRGVGITFRQTS